MKLSYVVSGMNNYIKNVRLHLEELAESRGLVLEVCDPACILFVVVCDIMKSLK